MSNQLKFEIGEAVEDKGNGTFTLPFYEYNITVTFGGRDGRKKFFSRRYNDFLALRNMLSAKYWACIVPPIPEKEGKAETMEKVKNAVVQVVKGKDEGAAQDIKTRELILYRQDLLQIFLQMLCDHPAFRNDELLTRYFIDDDEWEKKVKESVSMPSFLSVGLLSSGKGAAKRSGGNPAGLTYAKVVGDLKESAASGENDGGKVLSMTELEGIARHMNNLALNFATLKEKTEALAHQRREIAVTLGQFATAFVAIVEDEEDETLKKAVNPVALHCGSMSTLYDGQYNAELKNVVFKLGYQHLSAVAVGETVERLYVAVQHVQQLQNKCNALQAEMAKATVSQKSAALENQKNEVVGQKREVESALFDGMKRFKDDFVHYHDSKQKDVQGFLDVFKKMQMDSADKMKKEWDDVQSQAQETLE